MFSSSKGRTYVVEEADPGADTNDLLSADRDIQTESKVDVGLIGLAFHACGSQGHIDD